MLDDKLKALWTRISPPQKAAFFGCFLSGYLVHLYVFTNIIPNSDGLSRIFDPQQMTVSGRWFLHFASYFNGFTQMPAVIGLFSVLFLALAAALAVSLLGIRSRALSALSGADYCLNGGEEGGGAVSALRDAEEAVAGIRTLSDDMGELYKRLEQLRCEAYDLAEIIRDKREAFDFSPAELDAVESDIHIRIEEIALIFPCPLVCSP